MRREFSIRPKTEIFTSESILKAEGFAKLVSCIQERSGRCRVAILGGSHSAFSILALLVNGPTRVGLFEDAQKKFQNKFNKLKMQNKGIKRTDLPQEFPSIGPKSYQLKVCNNCISCPHKLTHSSDKKCLCGIQCCCLSQPRINLPSSGIPNSSLWPVLKPQDKIQVIYRKQIKVHFASVAEASNHSYKDFDQNLDLSKGGIVYPFTGIRGEAKDLWMAIRNGHVSNVELVRADLPSEQANYLAQADVVIVACGYNSVQVPIHDLHGQRIPLAVSHPVKRFAETIIQGSNPNKALKAEQVEVNHNCQVMHAQTRRAVHGLYGIGQGYSLATNDSSVQAEQRHGSKADSVGLYIKQIGNKILGQILPSSIFKLAAPSDVDVSNLLQGQLTYQPTEHLKSSCRIPPKPAQSAIARNLSQPPVISQATNDPIGHPPVEDNYKLKTSFETHEKATPMQVAKESNEYLIKQLAHGKTEQGQVLSHAGANQPGQQQQILAMNKDFNIGSYKSPQPSKSKPGTSSNPNNKSHSHLKQTLNTNSSSRIAQLSEGKLTKTKANKHNSGASTATHIIRKGNQQPQNSKLANISKYSGDPQLTP